MEWFKDCKTTDEIKAKYRDLAKEYHPDLGGNLATMQEINAEYAIASENARRAKARADAASNGKPMPSEAEFVHYAQVDEILRQKIDELLKVKGIEINIAGFWLWIDGETKPVKYTLKTLGCRWAPHKGDHGMWYYAGIPAGGHGRWTMEQIYERYGRRTLRSRRDNDLAVA